MRAQSQFAFLFSGPPASPPLTGRELMESGMVAVLSHTPETWKESFTDEIKFLPFGARFTMESIRTRVGDPPSETHPNAMGAMTRCLAKRGMIRKTGVVLKTHRPERRNSDLPEWERTRGKGE